jgi:hypothetical protein
MEKKYKDQLDHYFKLIAIRTITPTTVECNEVIRTTIVQAIQKSMSGDNDWHFFCHGSKVSDNEKEVFIPSESLYDYHLFAKNGRYPPTQNGDIRSLF